MAAARKHGVSEQSIYRWRNKYAGMEVSDVRELKRVKDENMRLKKLLAERDLEVEVMKEIQAKKW
ncbi:transposase [Candidatus Vondammii sp. HM_W22]|uniref:transposase n=1 Tax=Candidatus Vondammii sp. HM_W22 TaxID=2687299 RepID=UPI001F13EAA2|nr:transposase [Candidatus Vondammii sp. HM_W22]